MGHLVGIVVAVKRNGQEQFRLFPSENLPESDPKQAFEAIFAIKKHWKVQEIEPYIERLVGPDQTKADLLKKFTRTCRSLDNPSEKVLCAK